MLTSTATDEIIKALIEVQDQFPALEFDKDNPYYRSRYTTLGAMIKATKPILKAHGLAIVQTNTSDGDKVGVTTRLIHISGQWMQDTAFLMLKGATDKTSLPQVAGITFSYFRRYQYAAILNLYSEEDTDGNMDGYEKPPKQVSKVSYKSKATKPVKAKAKHEEEEVDPNSIEALLEEFGHKWQKARGLGNEEKDLPKIKDPGDETEVIEKLAELNIILKESLGE